MGRIMRLTAPNFNRTYGFPYTLPQKMVKTRASLPSLQVFDL
jgi:hypothetical protein